MQLGVREAAELLSVSDKTVYRWIAERGLPGYRLSGQYRFNRSELLAWATANRVNVSPLIFAEDESVPAPDPADALRAGGIFYRLSAADKTEALRCVVEHLRLPDGSDRDLLLQMLLARESLESTAIGDGIAIPHARNPILLHVDRPLVTLCFLERAVEFGALDGKPVHALFTVVSPTAKAHLHLLSRIAFAVRDPVFKRLIVTQANRDEIMARLEKIVADLKSAKGPKR